MKPIAFLAILLVASPVVQANLVRVFWRSTPITPAAIANDPALANHQVFDLMVELQGNQFSFGQLWMNLPSGSIYNHPFGSNIAPTPTAVTLFPALAYDTFVTVPPPASCLARDALAITGIPILSGASVDVSMFADNNTGQQPAFGEFLIGRFTVPLGVVPEVNPLSVVFNRNQQPTRIPAIPEPATGAILLLALTAGRRSKRQR